jgi:hypothetical protein
MVSTPGSSHTYAPGGAYCLYGGPISSAILLFQRLGIQGLPLQLVFLGHMLCRQLMLLPAEML